MTGRTGWRRVAHVVLRLPALAVIGLLRLWQLVVSPVYGQTCRFYPSCTSYALGAVETHGLLRGGWLTLRRLARCHPWNPGGVDLVPARGPRRGGHGRAVPTPAPGDAAGGTPTTPATPVADHRPPRRAA
jgi:hypothetical protein